MKLLSFKVIKADTCGGLMDGLMVDFRGDAEPGGFDPICLIGRNGTGKSQLLQVIAEAFQAVYREVAPAQERIEANPALEFIVEYEVWSASQDKHIRIRASRKMAGRRKPKIVMEMQQENQWQVLEPSGPGAWELVPSRVVAYTSGENETLSLPFTLSRSGYAAEVTSRALNDELRHIPIPDTRLMLIDYGTNLEVLVANLAMQDTATLTAILEDTRLAGLDSFRCVVSLAHPAVRRRGKGIQLTPELEKILRDLRSCATAFDVDEAQERYTFVFHINEALRRALRACWKSPAELYLSFHKLAMLNDLAIQKTTRQRFIRQTGERRFATRLPEPQDEQKVFFFDQVKFKSDRTGALVDYVSLSDGEHQLLQLRGMFLMFDQPNVLFLLDEPDSHFNPPWRIRFVTGVLSLPTSSGPRVAGGAAAHQDCLITTHAPFVPSDLKRNNVLIFNRDADSTGILVQRPNMETYGATFDSVLSECFDVFPPMSARPSAEIERLKNSTNPKEIAEGLQGLGPSVDRALLAGRLDALAGKEP